MNTIHIIPPTDEELRSGELGRNPSLRSFVGALQTLKS